MSIKKDFNVGFRYFENLSEKSIVIKIKMRINKGRFLV